MFSSINWDRKTPRLRSDVIKKRLYFGVGFHQSQLDLFDQSQLLEVKSYLGRDDQIMNIY